MSELARRFYAVLEHDTEQKIWRAYFHTLEDAEEYVFKKIKGRVRVGADFGIDDMAMIYAAFYGKHFLSVHHTHEKAWARIEEFDPRSLIVRVDYRHDTQKAGKVYVQAVYVAEEERANGVHVQGDV